LRAVQGWDGRAEIFRAMRAVRTLKFRHFSGSRLQKARRFFHKTPKRPGRTEKGQKSFRKSLQSLAECGMLYGLQKGGPLL
jgi:hypothetical protein